MPISTINSLGDNGELSVAAGTLNATVAGSPLTYTDSTAHILFYDTAESAVVANSVDTTYRVMKTFTAARQGPLRVRFEAYILSGRDYFAYQIRKNSSTVIATGYFSSNLDGAVASVHAHRPFTMVTSTVSPGDVITVEMVSSNGSGVPVVGTSAQTLYLRNLRISAGVPDVTYSNAVARHYVPLKVPYVWSTTYTGQTAGTINVVSQWGLPSGVKALQVVGFYNVTGYGGNGYSDHALSQYGPRAQAGPDPWSFNTSTQTEWGSFVLEHDGDASGSPHYYGAWNGVGLINVGDNDIVYYTVGRGLSGGTHYNTLWVWGYWI